MNTDTMLSTSETAAKLGVRPQTLRKWRLIGKGPMYIRLGATTRARVAYRLEAIEEWINDHTFCSTSQETATPVPVRPVRAGVDGE